MNDPNISELKKRSMELSPLVRIGKSGITEGLIVEIDKQLKLHKLVKIKFLKAAVENFGKEELANKILAETGSIKVLLHGSVLVVYREACNKQKSL